MIIGITGSFGSGKTTVAGMFKSFGVEVIDVDKIAHRIIKPRSKIYKKIISAFGKDILKNNKTIDRHKLAQIVFNNKNLLKKINRIMHPEIIGMIKNRIKTSRSKLIILDTPLLIEAGLKDRVDKLIVVKVDRRHQIQRLLNKTSLTRAEILRRIKAQISLRDKVRLADFVIDNSGTIDDTERQVKKIAGKLKLAPRF